MDLAFLPLAENPADPALPLIGAVVTVDPASRYVHFDPITSTSSSTPVEAIKRWRGASGVFPRVVHTDGGTEFKGDFETYLHAHEIVHDTGTPENSKGRGVVERLVKTLKHALVASIPQGQLSDWPQFLDTVERATNHLPHSSLGNLSPWQFRFAEHAPPPIFNWCPEDSPLVSVDRLANCVTALRELADLCSSVATLHRAATSPPDALSFNVGDTVFLSHARVHKSALESSYYFYEGTYLVSVKEVDSKGSPTGWFTVREILANHSPTREVLGPPREVVSSRLYPLDVSRTDFAELHLRKLPSGFGIPETILKGPSQAKATLGRYLVKWVNVPTPSWEDPALLASTTVFKEFLASRRKGRPSTPPTRSLPTVAKRSSSTPREAGTLVAAPLVAAPLKQWSPLDTHTLVEVTDPSNPQLAPALAEIVVVVAPSSSLPKGGYIVQWASSSLRSDTIPAPLVLPLVRRRKGR
jgi:hypothetical protein